MSIWSRIVEEASADGTPFLVAGFAATLVVVAALARERRGVKGTTALLALHVLLVLVAAGTSAAGSDAHNDVRFAARVLGAMSAVGMGGTIVFGLALPRLRLGVSRLLQDLAVGAACVVAVVVLAKKAGYDLGSLIATSAVLTAVIGFALQDTLGNVIGGLALQTDNSIQVGDWIKVGDVNGRVVEMRWRYTAIETRNWETLLVPNSQLMKGQVTVLGRRQNQPVQWRRWVYFNVDFRHAPPDVIEVVMNALRSAPLEHVAADPPPNCILFDLHESYARYAVRYWLTDLAADDPTDGVVRTRVYFALRRAGIPLSIPAAALFVTEESADRKVEKNEAEMKRRAAALEHVELFAPLSDEDRARLARSLSYAPFARGEVITRQGAEAHWLYLILDGEASVRVRNDAGLEREVTRLSGGSFFGEMSLMTGERRAATVVAVTDVDCYRLDKAAFQAIVRERPDLAEPLAAVLARRRVELEAAREGLNEEARERREQADKRALVAKIREFFKIDA